MQNVTSKGEPRLVVQRRLRGERPLFTKRVACVDFQKILPESWERFAVDGSRFLSIPLISLKPRLPAFRKGIQLASRYSCDWSRDTTFGRMYSGHHQDTDSFTIVWRVCGEWSLYFNRAVGSQLDAPRPSFAASDTTTLHSRFT